MNNITNVYFDTEFTELSKNGKLISIGLVAMDRSFDILKAFYAEVNEEYYKDNINDFVRNNVIPNLFLKTATLSTEISYSLRTETTFVHGTIEQIRNALVEWLDEFDSQITLVSDVAHYDMTLFIDIFGTAKDLPSYICPAVYDINQDIARYSNCSLKLAFDMNREKLLSNMTNVDITSSLYRYYKSMGNRKHNSLYDAVVIYLLYIYLNAEV